MSIHFISGKPGAGKSFYGVKLAFEELRYGDRHIVTNLPLLVGELNAYYHSHYADDSGLRRYIIPWWIPKRLAGLFFWMLPEALVFRVFPLDPRVAEKRMLQPRRDDIGGRIHLISDEEMAVFFTKRPQAEIAHVANDAWKKGVRPDYSVVKDAGVFFILDEVHIAFNSRAWAETGAEVLYYLSQHRKLGDDVICITQSVGNVDKQFRSVAQDFTYIRNLAKETFGHFRLPARFIRKTYSQPPSGDKSEPMEMGSFTLDINGLAKCYDTAKGVGIHGRAGADKNARKKGIHWLWFVAGVPLLLIFVLHYFPHIVSHFVTPGSHVVPLPAKSSKAVLGTVHDAPHEPAQAVGSENVQAVSKNPAFAGEATNEIFCSGWFITGRSCTVFLSDGSSYSTDDGEVTSVSKRFVVVLGNTYQVQVGHAFSDWTAPVFISDSVAVGQLEAHSAPDNVQVTVIGQHDNRQAPTGNGFGRSNQQSVIQASSTGY